MMSTWQAAADLILVLAVALAFGTAAERLKLSAILGYLVAGTVSGPHGFALVRQPERVHELAEFGVVLLLFAIGLEFSWPRLKSLGSVALISGLLQIGVTIAVGALALIAIGNPIGPSLSFGAMIAMSSTACVLRVLMDRAALDSLYGRYSVGILLVQDVAVIPLLVLLTALNSGGTWADTGWLIGRTLVGGALVVGGLYVLLHYVAPRALTNAQWARNRELPVLLAVVLAIGSAGAAEWAHVSPALGAFVAGVVLGGSPFAAQIRADVGALRTVLVTLFFASIGMLADAEWALKHASTVAVVVLLVVVAKTLIVWIVMKSMGVPDGLAMATGLCIAQIGEFSFVLAKAVGEQGSAFGTNGLQVVTAASLVTLFITPLLIAGAPRIAVRWQALRAQDTRAAAGRLPPASGDGPPGTTERTPPAVQGALDGSPDESIRDILLIGFGPAGQMLAATLFNDFANRMLVLDLNPRNGEAAELFNLPFELGDGSSAEMLEHVHASRMRVIAVTVPDPDVALRMIEVCRVLAPQAALFVRSRYHVRRWELVAAGAREVVDEEQEVGMALAQLIRLEAFPELAVRRNEAWTT